MIPKQISGIVTTMGKEFVGETAIVAEDLSNVVEVGQTISDAMGYEAFTNTIVDKVGETIAVNREYRSTAPDILRRGTGIPYGSITEKLRVKLPGAVNNDSWPIGQTWTAGQGWTDATNPTNDNVSPFITVRPEVEATYFNGGGTFEIDMTYPTIQNRSAFTTIAGWRKFIDTVESRIFQKKTVDRDNLTYAVIRNLIAEKLVINNAVVDLLALYNATHTPTITAANAIYNPEFLRYAGYVMSLYPRRLGKMSRRYNAAGYDTFTPADRLRFVALDMFADAVETFMTSDTYHAEMVGLKDNYSTVDAWQGAGTSANIDFATSARINVTTASGETIDTATAGESSAPVYVVGTMFDVEAAWQRYDNPRTTSQYNARKEQTTFFYKEDVSYANDLAENCVVFTLGTPAD